MNRNNTDYYVLIKIAIKCYIKDIEIKLQEKS